MRFIDNKNGTVTDINTGLTWQKFESTERTWQETIDYAEDLNFAGRGDWRIPSLRELETLINRDKYKPASDFPNMPPLYLWSSSSTFYDLTEAWGINFQIGLIGPIHKKIQANVLYVTDEPFFRRHGIAVSFKRLEETTILNLEKDTKEFCCHLKEAVGAMIKTLTKRTGSTLKELNKTHTIKINFRKNNNDNTNLQLKVGGIEGKEKDDV